MVSTATRSMKTLLPKLKDPAEISTIFLTNQAQPCDVPPDVQSLLLYIIYRRRPQLTSICVWALMILFPVQQHCSSETSAYKQADKSEADAKQKELSFCSWAQRTEGLLLPVLHQRLRGALNLCRSILLTRHLSVVTRSKTGSTTGFAHWRFLCIISDGAAEPRAGGNDRPVNTRLPIEQQVSEWFLQELWP